jgi:hypothetical protein
MGAGNIWLSGLILMSKKYKLVGQSDPLHPFESSNERTGTGASFMSGQVVLLTNGNF